VSDFTTVWSHLGSAGAGAFVTGCVVFGLLRFLLPGYLGEKGKNLATREDIGHITAEIEKVKTQYARQLEQLRHELTLTRVSYERLLTYLTDYYRLVYRHYRACQRAASADAYRGPDGKITHADKEFLENLDGFLADWKEQEATLRLWLPPQVLEPHEKLIVAFNDFKSTVERFRGNDEMRKAKEEAFRAIDRVKGDIEKTLRCTVLGSDFRSGDVIAPTLREADVSAAGKQLRRAD
jgi:hypothetical protein